MNAIFSRLVLVLLGFGLGATVTQAAPPILLQVDVSNPAAVTLTATSNFSGYDHSSSKLDDGVYLLSFFTSSVPTQPSGPFLSETLAPSLNSGHPYNWWWAIAQVDADAVDLNLSRVTDYSPQYFSTSASAFTGTAIMDLSSIASYLPSLLGTSGSIVPWNSSNVLGQWEVVAIPEPTTLTLVGLGLLGVASMSRRFRCKE